MEIRVRPAYPRDIPALVGFNRALARETEDHDLDPEKLEKGVAALFEEPSRGSYFLAVEGDEPVGALLVTPEWSDWRNGIFWWIQSVYIAPAARGRGVFRRLYQHVHESARAARDVVGVRLYVDRDNLAAKGVYAAVGMRPARYEMFEVDFVLGGGPALTPVSPPPPAAPEPPAGPAPEPASVEEDPGRP